MPPQTVTPKLTFEPLPANWQDLISDPTITREPLPVPKITPPTPMKDLGVGAMKGLANTVIGLGELIHRVPGVSEAIDAFYGEQGLSKRMFQAAHDELKPANTTEVIGSGLEQLAEFAVPVSGFAKAGKAMRTAEAAKTALVTEAQGGSDTAAGVNAGLSVVVPLIARKASDLLEGSANRSMIRAMGPGGGRGPTGNEALEKATKLAPDLLDKGFMPLSQPMALAMAKKEAQQTAAELEHVLQLRGPSKLNQTFDKPKALAEIDKKIASFERPKQGGGTFVPEGQQQSQALWKVLRRDLEQSADNVVDIHTLKHDWNELVSNWKKDPAKATESYVYRKGSDLLRAQFKGDHAAISKADTAFSKAADLVEILDAPSAKRPVKDLITSIANPMTAGGAVIGGAEGYRRDGLSGAVTGALTGAALVRLLQSPGFRYVTAGMKQNLANALDAGDGQRIASLIKVLTVQADKLGKGK